MSGITVSRMTAYEDDRVTRGLDGGLYNDFMASGRGASARITAKALYIHMLHDVHEDEPDNGVWTSRAKYARRVGVSERTITSAQDWLGHHGFIYPWRSPRMKPGVRTQGFWVVDKVAEQAELDAWYAHARTAEMVAFHAAYPDALPDDAVEHAQKVVDDRLAAVQREHVDADGFLVAFPGAYATTGRLVQILNGDAPRVGMSRREAVAAHRGVREEVAEHLEALGVVDAGRVLAAELTAWRADGRRTDAVWLRKTLAAGGFDYLAGTPAASTDPGPAPIAVPTRPHLTAVPDLVDEPVADVPEPAPATVIPVPDLPDEPSADHAGGADVLVRPVGGGAQRARVLARLHGTHGAQVQRLADATGWSRADAAVTLADCLVEWQDEHPDTQVDGAVAGMVDLILTPAA